MIRLLLLLCLTAITANGASVVLRGNATSQVTNHVFDIQSAFGGVPPYSYSGSSSITGTWDGSGYTTTVSGGYAYTLPNYRYRYRVRWGNSPSYQYTDWQTYELPQYYSGTLTASAVTISSATYAQHSWSHALTNGGSLVENYRLILTRTNGLQVVEEFTLEPGEVWSGSITDTNAFSVSLEQFEPSGLNLDLWNPETGLPPINSTNVGSPPTPSVTSTPGGQGNIWGSDASTQLGSLPAAITATSAGARGTNFSDAATATATADSNSEKRFSELGSLLVAQDARSAQRAGVQAAQMAAGLDRVRDAVLSVGAHLGDALTNGQSIGYVPGGSGPSNSGVTLGTLTNGLRSLWPSWSPPSTGGTFQVAFPLSALHADLSDVVLDFTGDSNLSPWIGTFRAAWLVVVSVLFFIASLRLVGVLGGGQTA